MATTIADLVGRIVRVRYTDGDLTFDACGPCKRVTADGPIWVGDVTFPADLVVVPQALSGDFRAWRSNTAATMRPNLDPVPMTAGERWLENLREACRAMNGKRGTP